MGLAGTTSGGAWYPTEWTMSLSATGRKLPRGEVKPPARVSLLVNRSAGPGSLIGLTLPKLSPPTRRMLSPWSRSPWLSPKVPRSEPLPRSSGGRSEPLATGVEMTLPFL